MNNELLQRDKVVLEQVKAKAQQILQHYLFDENDIYQRQTKETVERILSLDKAGLDIYGILHGTDKASLVINDGTIFLPHDYLRQYEKFIKEFRDETITIIEFGCAEGASLRLWEDYFPKATIYGVDIVSNAQQFVTERINIVIGNAAYQDTYEAIEQDLNGERPYVIIDDASHAWSEQRITLQIFWKMLAPGGIYIIEDLECGTQGAYAEYKPEIEDAQPFFDFIQDRCKVLRWPRESALFTENAHQQLPEVIRTIEEELDMCTFIPGAIILRKRERE